MRDHSWTRQQVSDLFELPFFDLMLQAQTIHRRHFPANAVQVCSLLSVKTGACPEDCAYCPQSGHYQTGLKKEKLLPLQTIVEKALQAKQRGASRFCMGAAWRSLPDRALQDVIEMIQAIKALDMETCVCAGMLNAEQANALKNAGLDYYNHNLDTSPEFYSEIISTRTYQDRLDTLKLVNDAGIKICSGGIVGMGESREDRVGLLLQFANHHPQPNSVPINLLVPVKGTPLEHQPQLDLLEVVRTIAVARILMPKSMVRMSCGRDRMTNEMQAWVFFAGANSIFSGDLLLTTPNVSDAEDKKLFADFNLSVWDPRDAAS